MRDGWTKIVHVGRKWQRAKNHMDARHCPDCGATVHGSHGQQQHRVWHETDAVWLERLERLLSELSKRAGIAEEAVEMPWTWSAVAEEVEAADAELEVGDVGLQGRVQRRALPVLQGRPGRRGARPARPGVLPAP